MHTYYLVISRKDLKHYGWWNLLFLGCPGYTPFSVLLFVFLCLLSAILLAFWSCSKQWNFSSKFYALDCRSSFFSLWLFSSFDWKFLSLCVEGLFLLTLLAVYATRLLCSLSFLFGRDSFRISGFRSLMSSFFVFFFRFCLVFETVFSSWIVDMLGKVIYHGCWKLSFCSSLSFLWIWHLSCNNFQIKYEIL